MSPLQASFYVSEATRLRSLADNCSNPSLRLELLNRAAELEELAMSRDDNLVTLRQTQVIH